MSKDTGSEAKAVHLIGIGGAGMSGIARLLLGRGVAVSGSDLKESEATRALRSVGATVRIGHRAENVGDARRVVYTAAVSGANAELMEARRRGLEVLSRAEMLAELMRGRVGIAVAGTHGKTTTTAMIASVFLRAGADPSILVGGDWEAIGGNARAGHGRHFIAEACEAFDSFLELHPNLAVVTNIEADHLDWHKSEAGVVDAFGRFLAQLDPNGCAVVCRDDLRVQRLLPTIRARVLTYGLEDGAELTARDVEASRGYPRFTVMWRRRILGEARLSVPGRHNVLNALAALGVALEVGLPFSVARAALADFAGVQRRFELLGCERDVVVVDDYAHHPTEVAATLAAARAALGRHLIAVFQPHLYSRTQLLMADFARAFRDADAVVVSEVYAAREKPLPGVNGRALADAIAGQQPDKPVLFLATHEEIVEHLAAAAGPGSAVLTIGAGDIRVVGENLVRALREAANDRIEVGIGV